MRGALSPNEQAQKLVRAWYFIGLLTCQLAIETGQADGKGLERAKREAEIHGEPV